MLYMHGFVYSMKFYHNFYIEFIVSSYLIYNCCVVIIISLNIDNRKPHL